VLRWADQLLDVLTYLHSQDPPVVHRDIKPHNLKLNGHGAVILLDFGLAKGAPGQPPAERSLAGYTLHYAAPEQLRGEPTTAATDLYALAATLYDLLAAVKPPDALKRLVAIATGQPDPLRPLHTLNPAVPAALAAVIHQALALAPQARFADAAAMRLALHAASGDATQIAAARESAHRSDPPHNLPSQLTSLVGREEEAVAVQQLLQSAEVRLVTLSGPGGIGKTRLALSVATRCLAHFADGVYFVSLAPIGEIALVLPTIAQTLGLRDAPNMTALQSLQAHLQEKEMLLVVDNFEQVVAAAPALSDLLAACARLKLLVTSREALQVRGEQEFPVPALGLPDLKQMPAPEELAQSAAVRLFVQRAQAVKPGFALQGANGAAIAEICKRLDGLPLAIELAAASIKILPAQAILARLAERFDLPSSGLRDLPDRQRTLRASIGWSYDLLAEEERALFRRLCVFSGSFGLEAAEALCKKSGLEEAAVLEGIAALAGKSLLKPFETGEHEPRFTMLETIREFGLKQLEEERETEIVAAAHAAYYEQFAQEAGRRLWGADIAAWVSRLDLENDNLRAALHYYLAHAQGAEAALRLAGSLWRFWEMRGYIVEGRTWLDRALQRRAEAPPSGRWLALHGAGNLAVDQDDYAIARSYYLESLQLLQGLLPTLENADEILRTRYAIANTLTNLGHVAQLQSEYEAAAAYLEEALAIHHQLMGQPSRFNHRIGMAITITNLAKIKLVQSHYAQAEQLSSESLALYRDLGDERGIGWNLQRLGTIARHRGEYEQAAKLYQEARLLFEKLSNQADMAILMFDLGELAREQGEDETAEAAYQAGLTLAQALGNKKDIANLLDCLSILARRRGSYVKAAALCEQSIALQREIGSLFGLSESLRNRGDLAYAQQNYRTAAADYRESLKLKARLQERKGIVASFKALAALSLTEKGLAGRAARLLAAAETLRLALGIGVPPAELAEQEATVQAVRTSLGDKAFAAAWAAGEAFDLPDAIAYALEEE
jgi:predicted ATPase